MHPSPHAYTDDADGVEATGIVNLRFGRCELASRNRIELWCGKTMCRPWWGEKCMEWSLGHPKWYPFVSSCLGDWAGQCWLLASWLAS